MSMFLWRERAKQLIDFSSLSYGIIHPTDIDGVLEFNGKKLVLIELKYNGKEMDTGQRLTLERLCDCYQLRGDAITILADHYEENPENDIKIGYAVGRYVYYKGKWFDAKKRTVQDLVESFCGEEINEKLRAYNRRETSVS